MALKWSRVKSSLVSEQQQSSHAKQLQLPKPSSLVMICLPSFQDRAFVTFRAKGDAEASLGNYVAVILWGVQTYLLIPLLCEMWFAILINVIPACRHPCNLAKQSIKEVTVYLDECKCTYVYGLLFCCPPPTFARPILCVYIMYSRTCIHMHARSSQASRYQ